MATWLRLKGDYLSAYGFENKGLLTNIGSYIKNQNFWANEPYCTLFISFLKKLVRNLMKDSNPDQKLLDPVLRNLFDLRNFSRS